MRIILALRPVVSPSRVRCRGCILQAVKSWIAVPAQQSRQFNSFWIEGQNPCRPAVDVVFALCSRRRPGWGQGQWRETVLLVFVSPNTILHGTVRRSQKGMVSARNQQQRGRHWGKPSMQCSMLQLDRVGPGFCLIEVRDGSKRGSPT